MDFPVYRSCYRDTVNILGLKCLYQEAALLASNVSGLSPGGAAARG